MSESPKITGKVYIQIGDGAIEPIAQFEGVGKEQITTAIVGVVHEYSVLSTAPEGMNLEKFTKARRGHPGRSVRVIGWERSSVQPANIPQKGEEFESLAELASFIGVAPAQLHNALTAAKRRGNLSARVRGVEFCYIDSIQPIHTVVAPSRQIGKTGGTE